MCLTEILVRNINCEINVCTPDPAALLKRDVDVDYLNVKYRFMLVEKKIENGVNYAPSSSVYQMMDWFGLNKCFVLSPQQSAISSLSLRRVLYSAAVCAAEALHCSIPVFLVPTTVDALHRAREILGYALVTPADSRGGDNLQTIYYESSLLEGVAAKHVLFYLDGLRGLFGSKLLEFSNGCISLSRGIGLANVQEKYFYRLSENDRFLTRSVAYNNESKKLSLYPEIKSCIEDLAAAFPDRDDTSASLNKLVIEVDYGFRRFGGSNGRDHSVDDNEFFTTLHPSSLPFGSWKVQAEFLPMRNSSDLEPQGLSFCLRQLLAAYIAGKCCGNEQGISNMSGKNGDFPSVDRPKAISVAKVLSIKSRDAVSAVCTNTQQQFVDENGNPIGSGGSIPQDLLMRAFSRSMWIDVDTKLADATDDDCTGLDTTCSRGFVGEQSEFYGVGTSPWNWMANMRGAPVGSWLNLVAVYSGSLPDFCSMCYFWAECCHQLRVHFETGVPIPRLHPPHPVSAPSCTYSNQLKPRDRNYNRINTVLELWGKCLWDDVLENRAAKRMPFSLPDTQRCLIFQKLQKLQLCILCGEESVTVQLSSISTELDLGSAQTKTEQASNLHVVQDLVLQRRLPMTTDMNAHTQYLQDKLTSGKSRTGNDNPLLRWQVALPSVVSDARAFKAANPSANFDDFMEWYRPCSIAISTLEEIWTFCTPAHAEEQNALFKAEKEAEKVLGYLESLTPCQLTGEMLCTAMMSMHMVLFFDLLDTISSSNESAVHSDLLLTLKNEIETAIEMIREDCPGLHDTPDISISQHAILAVDKVCNIIQSMEETKARADSCRLQFDNSQSRLRTELSINGRGCATNPEEAKRLFDLSKNASRGDNHSWHSIDGRELGPPDVKVFDMWLLPQTLPVDLSEMLFALDDSRALFAQKICLGEMLKSCTESQQHMHATASGEELRVSMTIREANIF